ncbi:hypothetical protein [Streptomyces sp. AM8-1-1]|uniref:hypothetical protein n=1 Tax=Streptomyces sp. AM8-1-1 TaxID=3075825 RepID=UPI0028C49164|nr:hypothetical protein [Streptomyces sp. AM8-1-1]WNO70431.1 hypothetical protein RPQ07_01795 [Streptomyces sp. AM8-1-1]
MRVRLIAAGAAVVVMGLGVSASAAMARGHALEGDWGGIVGFHHATVGKGYWFACPPLRNTSDLPVEVLKAELLGAPGHWRTGEVRAARRSDTHGTALAAYDTSFVEDADLARDYSKEPVGIAPGEESPIYYLVRAEAVASPVSGEAEGCRVTYRTGNRIHSQVLPSAFELITGD